MSGIKLRKIKIELKAEKAAVHRIRHLHSIPILQVAGFQRAKTSTSSTRHIAGLLQYVVVTHSAASPTQWQVLCSSPTLPNLGCSCTRETWGRHHTASDPINQNPSTPSYLRMDGIASLEHLISNTCQGHLDGIYFRRNKTTLCKINTNSPQALPPSPSCGAANTTGGLHLSLKLH
jgi:hypothetical protein